jgi:2-polyprenyl-6-methoxyphenol hydroxylase-like FAD-dependent oxidoreductase
LKILYDGIPDKSKIHTSKRVLNVDHSNSGVVVHCQDGSKYSGDIVVGADGIHSVIRPLMLQYIESWNPGSTKHDRNSISAEYSCIFGLGEPVDGPVRIGDSHRTYIKDHSTLSFVGRCGRLYWFLFSKLDRRYYGEAIPKFTRAEMEEAAKAFFKIHMTDAITFDQVWERRTLANMSCVEESQNNHWTSGRFVCLGDSIHKVRPLRDPTYRNPLTYTV